jgi:hypothetical protein
MLPILQYDPRNWAGIGPVFESDTRSGEPDSLRNIRDGAKLGGMVSKLPFPLRDYSAGRWLVTLRYAECKLSASTCTRRLCLFETADMLRILCGDDPSGVTSRAHNIRLFP